MRRFVPRLLLPLLLLVVLAPAAVPCARADSTVMLNEFMAGPSRDWNGDAVFSSRDDEWVELVNTGAAAVDLSSYLITDGDRIPRLALTGTLAAGGHLAVYGLDSWNWEKAHGYPAFGFSLANGGDQVILWQVVGAETLQVDAAPYTSQGGASDRALGRSPDGAGSWVLFDSLNPYTGTNPPLGNGCAPTPGAENVCTTTPALISSWGRLKTLYR
jgi:lamin tail-like protein